MKKKIKVKEKISTAKENIDENGIKKKIKKYTIDEI